MSARSVKSRAKSPRKKASSPKQKSARKLKSRLTRKSKDKRRNKATRKPKRIREQTPLRKLKRARTRTSDSGGEDRLDRLFAAIIEVRAGLRTSPRTSRLLAGGPAKMAQKVIEEAAEVAIEAIRHDLPALINESADLLYNLAALWIGLAITPADVWREMDRREALLGIAEKLPKPASEPE